MVLAFDVFFLQARYFFQQLICGVSYCHFMVRKEQTTDLYFFSFNANKLLLLRHYYWCQLLKQVGFAANLPPRPQAREHAAGRQPGAPPQDLRLRLLQGATLSPLRQTESIF
jgi:hypothetical protein